MRGWLDRIPLKLLLALLVVQAGYWLVFHPNIVSPQPPVGKLEPAELVGFELAPFDEPTAKALATAAFRPMPQEQPFFLDKGYYGARATFRLDPVPAEGMGLLLADSSANRRVYVNGVLFQGEGRMELENPTLHGHRREIMRVPASMLKPGDNTVEAVMTMQYAEEAIIAPPLLAPYSQVRTNYGWQGFLFGPMQLLSLAVGTVVTLLAGVAWLRSDRRGALGWFVMLSLIWTTSTMLIVWVDMPLPAQFKLVLYPATILLMGLTWPILADSWTGEPVHWLRILVAVGAAVGLGAILWHFVLADGPGSYETVEDVLRWIGLFALIAMILRLIWHFARRREDKHWEAALLISMGVIFGSALWKSWGDAIGSVEFTRTQPLFLLLFMIAFFGRNFRLFRSQEQIAGMLRTQLEERTTQLELAHGREKELVREQAHHEERGRIMRDMHDGLGSNLMSMLLAARRGVADPEAVAEGLQSVVDEMRLMIDSMDSVGESLATALATFRGRVADRITGAGFKLDWQDDAPRPLPDYSPRAVLQVFRVMQEAVTNALKHSGGDTIAIHIADGIDAAEPLSIAIRDNGAGRLTANSSRGRGLDNMRSRAASIGARIEFLEHETGLTVRLALPSSAAKPV